MWNGKQNIMDAIFARYDDILDDAPADDLTQVIRYLSDELSDLWCYEYEEMTFTPDSPHNDCDIGVIRQDSFTYLHDSSDLTLFADPDNPRVDDRLIAVYGHSHPPLTRRDASRMRGWLGATDARFAGRYDKGHFISHAAGGELTLNLFFQRREINRGWSVRGRLYREMERYCAAHPGTFCFSRPLYCDRTWHPCAVELGLVMSEGVFWVERFDN
jgi:hypothetical protein